MKISQMFQKKIQRPVQGIIKVTQDSADIMAQELEEYVVTRELNRHFDVFFENYCTGIKEGLDHTGVWVGGPFGSGKSLFLKVLSCLLSGREYKGRRAVDILSREIEDRHTIANMRAAAEIQADTLLFHMDEDGGRPAAGGDRVVRDFRRAFDHFQGFCENMPWIADLERQMTRDGVYGNFCRRFRELSGSDWKEAREDFYFEEENIVKALADTTQMSSEAAKGWYQNAERNDPPGIDDLVHMVQEYIEERSAAGRKKQVIVFLYDGVDAAQNDVSCLLSLQAITERLGELCSGQAWVVAAGKQDVDAPALPGSGGRTEYSDALKTASRFRTRILLSSEDGEEIVRKRLLAKTDAAAGELKHLYAERSSDFKELFRLSSDVLRQQLYGGEEEFTETYPFVPYQFSLLRSVFQTMFRRIPIKGAAIGGQNASGDGTAIETPSGQVRSLLHAFQAAAVRYQESQCGALVPFSAFYQDVEPFLNADIRGTAAKAADMAAGRDGGLEPFDLEVWKALVLIRYVSAALPANVENITTIMVKDIGEDRAEAEQRTVDSLARLEARDLIVSIGQQYMFLVIEDSRRDQPIEIRKGYDPGMRDRIVEEFVSLLFNGNKTYRYKDYRDFTLRIAINDQPWGMQKGEIGIRVMLSTHDRMPGTEDQVKARSVKEQSVVIVLPARMKLIRRMEQWIRLKAYMLRLAELDEGSYRGSGTADADTGALGIGEGAGHCHGLLADMVREADIYVNGNMMDGKEKEPVCRISDAVRILVESLYTKLNCIIPPFDQTEPVSSRFNEPAREEMLKAINLSCLANIPVTMESLVRQFSGIPYGWRKADTAGTVLALFEQQDIELVFNGCTLTAKEDDLLSYVTRQDYLEYITVKSRFRGCPQLADTIRRFFEEQRERLDHGLRILSAYEKQEGYRPDPGLERMADLASQYTQGFMDIRQDGRNRIE